MLCRNCESEARETSYGPWCDACGGVYLRKGEPYVRHVATAKGHGGEFPILYDHTLGGYTFSYQRLVRTWVQLKNDWVQANRTFTNSGSLDLMIAMAQPHAKGDGKELPELMAGHGATKEEIAQLDMEMPDFNALEPVSIENLGIDKV